MSSKSIFFDRYSFYVNNFVILYIYGKLFLDEIENEIGINDINLVNYINIDNIDINVEDFLDQLYEVDVMLDELLKGDIFVEKVCDNVLIDKIKFRINNFWELYKSFCIL